MERQRHLEGLRADLRSGVRAMREVQVRVGRTLLEIRRSNNLLLLGSTSFPIFCEQEGLSPVEARELTAMAEAAESSPEVVERVVEAKITPQKAAVVNQLLKTPEIRKPGEDLLAFVESRCAKDVVNEVRRRREEARLGEPPVSLLIQVSAKGRDDFRRCQTLVSRSLDRVASERETLERISDEYLERHDPERKARRLEVRDKSEAPLKVRGSAPFLQGAVDSGRSRHVPAVDTRELLRAAGDRCWVDGCPKVSDSGRLRRSSGEPETTAARTTGVRHRRFCRHHHAQFDEGLWRLIPRLDGQVVLMDRRGVRVGRLRDEAAAFVLALRRAPP